MPGSGKTPGEVNGNPLQYFCLENFMARGAWQATVHGVTKSRTRLSDFHTHTYAQVEKDNSGDIICWIWKFLNSEAQWPSVLCSLLAELLRRHEGTTPSWPSGILSPYLLWPVWSTQHWSLLLWCLLLPYHFHSLSGLHASGTVFVLLECPSQLASISGIFFVRWILTFSLLVSH